MGFVDFLRPSHHLNSSQNPVWMDGLRALLGIFLLAKGIFFMEHSSDVLHLLLSGDTEYERADILISLVNIIGGIMILIGMLTRLALLCQIPVIIGAALIVDPNRNTETSNTELWVALVLLFLLVFFMVVGPGRYSVDNKILRPKPDSPEATPSSQKW